MQVDLRSSLLFSELDSLENSYILEWKWMDCASDYTPRKGGVGFQAFCIHPLFAESRPMNEILTLALESNIPDENITCSVFF